MARGNNGGRERRTPAGGRRSEDQELRALAQDAKDMATEALAQVEKHEAVCAERFGHIKETLEDGKKFQQWALRGGIVALLTLMGDILLHILKIG